MKDNNAIEEKLFSQSKPISSKVSELKIVKKVDRSSIIQLNLEVEKKLKRNREERIASEIEMANVTVGKCLILKNNKKNQ